MSDIRAQLSTYIDTAFTHEDDFLQTFCEGMSATDLMECHMGPNRTRITVVVASGTQINHSVSTTKFMMWCEDKNGLIQEA
jgi:hypothetical protein